MTSIATAKKKDGMNNKKPYLFLLIIVLVIIAASVYIVFFYYSGGTNATQNTRGTQNATQFDPYAHLSSADFALVSPEKVLASNTQFVSLAREKYVFLYANASNFTAVDSSQFIILVVNDTGPYMNIALSVFNATVLDYALNDTNGIILSKNNVWSNSQTVFVLAGYKNASTLSAALLKFFVKSPVYAPQKLIGKFMNFNSTSKNSSGTPFGSKDPILQASLDGAYPLSPQDTALPYPYSYYLNFAYLVYQAPFFSSYAPGFSGGASGLNLPMHAMLCIPPPPPPDSSSICIGNYVAMPVFQFGTYDISQPEWSFDTGDCNFFGISDCIDTEGWAASGINPQLPYSQIPSIFYGFSTTLSGIPPSLTGTTGPLSDSLPLTWWNYGPGSVGTSTGGAEQNIITQNQTLLLMNASVEAFSAPYSETPFGNFTGYSGNNTVTYSCSSSLCGMNFNYYIYVLMTESSTIPAGAYITSPSNYELAPGSNYYALFDPVTLSTPKVVVTPSATYYFSYWSVYSEIGGNSYHQVFNTSNATFQIIGPTQVKAIYTVKIMPGSVKATSAFMTPSAYYTCPPPLSNCNNMSSLNPISGVQIKITGQSGNILFSNFTDSSGSVTTPALPGGCYDVSAYKNGYIFLVEPNPICVNGNTELFAIDLSPYIVKINWPIGYPSFDAPLNKSVPINAVLEYSDGIAASNVSIRASASTGTINSSITTSSNGSAYFVWNSGDKPGKYSLGFTPTNILFQPPTYNVPVIVYPNNSTLTYVNVLLRNSTLYAYAGSHLSDNVSASFCRLVFGYPANLTDVCSASLPMTFNLTWTPAGINYTFKPSITPANYTTNSSRSTLSINVSNYVTTGVYKTNVAVKVTSASGLTYSATAPLSIVISQYSYR